ncbi:hypothetical protein MTR67_008944 [Solanum verrucosum]|uniref:Glycolipid transfer protein domain-containing protein n=1 Tax=Solanum verrucosum TaxID=315347 RepID=A0AAF0Q8Z0_SOLVR|nr:hypothetical protein MTR67_008944 [Solanum verrucosum]
MANHAAEEKPLRKMAEAFKDLANTLNSQTLDEAAKMEVAPFSHACTLVSPLFRCLGIAFKFAELDYVAKVGDLAEASKSITTLHTMMDQDIQANCVRKAGSHTRNLLRVKRGLDMVKVLFEEIIAADVLDALPTYMMSVFPAPAGVIDRIEVLRRTFFWQGNEDKRKYHLVKWEEMNISKKIGGVGIRNMKFQNHSLMMKWLWKFAYAENSLWKEVIAAKCGMRDKWMTTKVTPPYGSSVPLSQRFPDLYDLCQMQQATVAELWNDQGWNLHLRRNLNDWEMCRITEFLVTLAQFSNLSQEEDSLVWNVGSKGCFTVNSTYEDLNTVDIEEVEWPWKMIWKTKIPYKVDTPKKSCNLMGLRSCTVIVMGQCRAGLSGAGDGSSHESTLWLRNRYHRGNSLKDPASKAYTQVFAPYHGWAIRKAVSAGMYALPTRQQLMIKLNEDEDSARTQMQNYVASCETVITYIDKLFTSRDLGIDW